MMSEGVRAGMSSWLAWGIFAIAGVFLGWVGYHFTVRTLRFVAAALVAAVIVLVTGYGVRHPTRAPADLVNAFIRGMDDLSGTFFQPLLPGHKAPVPGQAGWLVIIALLVFAYRELEVWAVRWQPPAVDISALGGDGPGTQENSGRATPGGGPQGKRDHDKLVAELRFRLPAVEVRAPPIVPGGTAPTGLASIAENSGVAGSGLAGAIIRLVGMLWPTPRRYQVRVWVWAKPADPSTAANSCGQERTPAGRSVTVDIEDAQAGGSIATKTLAARDLDDAAARVAAYVARQIFKADPTAPAWSVGSFDGSDLAALLCAKQQCELIDCPQDAHHARRRQIEELERAVCNSPGAGVARYELALLYDLEGRHAEALWLHAINRKQYPRFFRGRYRLGMSLEMIANPGFGTLKKKDADKFAESLSILDQCGVTGYAAPGRAGLAAPLSRELRKELLTAARNELHECRRQLTLWRLIWATFLHRDERAMRRPYWRLGERQRFQDGIRVAELLVAVRQSLNEQECACTGEDRRQEIKARRHPRRALRITAAIAGGNAAIEAVGDPNTLAAPEGGAKIWKPGANAEKTRWLPWQRRTPSWQAAYNAACLYTVLADSGRYRQNEEYLMDWAVVSLKRVVDDRHCEMERPWDWISRDPDLRCLNKSPVFRELLRKQKQNDYPRANPGPDQTGTELAGLTVPGQARTPGAGQGRDAGEHRRRAAGRPESAGDLQLRGRAARRPDAGSARR
jgi:hypothetical protein